MHTTESHSGTKAGSVCSCTCPPSITSVLAARGCHVQHTGRGAPHPSQEASRDKAARMMGCSGGDRRVLATRDVALGEVIWAEDPFSFVALFPEMTGSERCSACLDSNTDGRIRRCGGCKMVLYCSKQCQTNVGDHLPTSSTQT